MSDAVATTIITQLGLLILGIITILGRQMHDRSVNALHHSTNTQKLDDLSAEVKEVKKELPDGGITAWVSTVENNTAAIKGQSNATTALAGIVNDLKTTVASHGNMLEELMGGGTA